LCPRVEDRSWGVTGLFPAREYTIISFVRRAHQSQSARRVHQSANSTNRPTVRCMRPASHRQPPTKRQASRATQKRPDTPTRDMQHPWQVFRHSPFVFHRSMISQEPRQLRPMDAMDGERSAGDLGFHFWKNSFL
jgi:hypothetical protein